MDNLTNFLNLFPADDLDAIRKRAEQMGALRRERLIACANAHRFDLIGQDGETTRPAHASPEATRPGD